MIAQALLIPGGIGLFILGMTLLTEGLRGLSGDALRRFLVSSTKTPVTGALAGMATTALIQSSSATTVMAVGFVSAGLLTFPQALGIIFGANIGTTITGWFVAILGFKLKIGAFAMVMVFIGALLRLFARGWLREFGWALAGFGLLFLGIDALQQGMAQFHGAVTPASFPEDTFFGRLQLVLLGVAITVITQSSSAGVATALAAIGAGAISFPQAAALVIGMDIGTTFTAALATLGGSTATRRTGYAHVVYNCLTGVMAFMLLTPFATLVMPWVKDPQIGLVLFHTFFNALGVVLVLPFADPFASLMQRLVPEKGPPLLRRLDERLLSEPGSAIDAAAATISDIFSILQETMIDLLRTDRQSYPHEAQLNAVEHALAATRDFIERLRTDKAQTNVHKRHVAAMHCLDHLFRLARRCRQERRIEVMGSEPALGRLASLLRNEIIRLKNGELTDASANRFDRLRAIMRKARHTYRARQLEAASQEMGSARETLERLDAMRWLQRVTYHLWRITVHMQVLSGEPPSEAAFRDLAEDVADD